MYSANTDLVIPATQGPLRGEKCPGARPVLGPLYRS